MIYFYFTWYTSLRCLFDCLLMDSSELLPGDITYHVPVCVIFPRDPLRPFYHIYVRDKRQNFIKWCSACKDALPNKLLQSFILKQKYLDEFLKTLVSLSLLHKACIMKTLLLVCVTFDYVACVVEKRCSFTFFVLVGLQFAYYIYIRYYTLHNTPPHLFL